MDYRDNASKDFSLVIWGTSNQPVSITADMDETSANQSHWPLTFRQSNDMNADQESGADACYPNPHELAFKDWTESFARYPSS